MDTRIPRADPRHRRDVYRQITKISRMPFDNGSQLAVYTRHTHFIRIPSSPRNALVFLWPLVIPVSRGICSLFLPFQLRVEGLEGKNPRCPTVDPVSHCEGAKVAAEVNPHLKRR